LTLALAACLAAGSARAGGLYINEFATPSMGTASAGAQAVATDASTTFHNAAGMTRLEGHQLLTGFGGVVSDVQFDPDDFTPVPGNDGGQQGSFAPIAGLYYVHSISDRFKIGADLNAISGAVLDPDNQWTGRLQLQEVSILAMELGLSFAYEVNNWLSVGAGPRFQYGVLNYTLSTPSGVQVELDKLDDFQVGFKASVLFTLSEHTRIGVNYSSKTELDLDGDINFKPTPITASINTKLPFPRLVRGSIYHELNDRWAVMGTVGWEQWSDLDDQFVSVGRVSGSVPRNWDDTYHFSVGVHFRPTDRWLLTAGFAYDTNPVSASDRTADMPIDRQLALRGRSRIQLQREPRHRRSLRLRGLRKGPDQQLDPARRLRSQRPLLLQPDAQLEEGALEQLVTACGARARADQGRAQAPPPPRPALPRRGALPNPTADTFEG
jgi:long-chain fatty acid transport protein